MDTVYTNKDFFSFRHLFFKHNKLPKAQTTPKNKGSLYRKKGQEEDCEHIIASQDIDKSVFESRPKNMNIYTYQAETYKGVPGGAPHRAPEKAPNKAPDNAPDKSQTRTGWQFVPAGQDGGPRSVPDQYNLPAVKDQYPPPAPAVSMEKGQSYAVQVAAAGLPGKGSGPGVGAGPGKPRSSKKTSPDQLEGGQTRVTVADDEQSPGNSALPTITEGGSYQALSQNLYDGPQGAGLY